MPLDQNSHQTVTRFGRVGFSMYACGFSVSQMRQFCLFTYPPRSKWASSEKMIFFAKIGVYCKSIAGPLSEAITHWMVDWLQLLNQMNFVWRHTKVFMQYSYQWCLRNVQLLRTTANWCWWHFTHTLSATAAIFWFWLFTLWFVDKNATFFHFFHKIANIRSWRCFSSSKIRMQFSHTFCNITMIFKVMSQYLPALFKRIHNHIRSAEG